MNSLHFLRKAAYWGALVVFAAALIVLMVLYAPPAFADTYEVMTCSRSSF